jgi:putative transposase
MNNNESSRKRVKHFEDRKCVHELTFSCYRRLPLLTNAKRLQMLSEAVSRACDRHNFDLLAFVWMPEHVHLLALPRTIESSVSALLNAIKRPFSYRVKQSLIEQDKPLLEKLTVRQRPGVTTFRFWQEGGGYDRNLWTSAAIQSAIDYIHMNPVRRGLCEKPCEWRWSSARFFDDPSMEVDEALPVLSRINWQLDE